jgi:hypothetical protein
VFKWFDLSLGIDKKEQWFIFAPGLLGCPIGLLSRQANTNYPSAHDGYPAVGIEFWVDAFG